MAGSIPSGSTYEDEAAPLGDINVTPLVDVTLVLLIVFMITVPAIVGTAPVKVDLPESSDIPAVVEETPLVFTLKRGAAGALELYLNERRIDEAGVRTFFQDLGPAAADRKVSLSAGRGLLWDDVVKVIDLLISLGVEKLNLNTRHVEAR
jgi:biopolymer transport protein ExbD